MHATIRTIAFLTLLTGNLAAGQQVEIGRGSIVSTVTGLKPGQYVWAPQVAPQGPMLLIVNLSTQRALLFRNGVPIGASTVSTGKPGHTTPTGIFTVLQKQVEHYSSKYDSAPMPYMQRLTWYGVALHAGNLPGYPASHGCIRLPKGFAKLLYGETSVGMTVVISQGRATPRLAPTPQIVADTVNDRASIDGGFVWNPEKAPQGPLSIVVSGADKKAVVLRNGVEIGSAPVVIDRAVDGTWAYTLRDVDSAGQHWIWVPLLSTNAAGDPVSHDEWGQFHAPEAFKQAVASIVRPGTTIVVTSDSLVSGALAVPVTVIDGDSKARK